MFKSSMSKKRRLGQFYMVLRSDAFVKKNYFLKNLDKMYREIKKQKKRKNRDIYLPNDKEVNATKERLKKGIPIDKALYDQIINISNKHKINL